MDKFEHEGKTYVAKEEESGMGLCDGCAFIDDDCVCKGSFQCEANQREDKREIIWVEEKA